MCSRYIQRFMRHKMETTTLYKMVGGGLDGKVVVLRNKYTGHVIDAGKDKYICQVRFHVTSYHGTVRIKSIIHQLS